VIRLVAAKTNETEITILYGVPQEFTNTVGVPLKTQQAFPQKVFLHYSEIMMG
jgi:hypothetical protein